MVLDRRRSYRRSVFIDARIAFGGRFRLRCLVQNLSDAGAKTTLKTHADIPKQFVLAIRHTRGEACQGVHVKWARLNCIGVEFSSEPLPVEPLPGLSAAP
jgi:hypothetical protein